MSLPFGTILLPYDGSAPAKAAAAHARVIAAASGATVVLAYVLPGYELLAEFGAGPTARRDATAMLAEVASTFAGKTELRLLEGDPAEAVAAEAGRMGADLVILGARGRSPLIGLVLGSTARKLLTVVTRPVLVAHDDIEGIRNIVAGVEQSEGALRVVAAAGALAGLTGARLTLVNVVDADPALVAHPDRFGITPAAWREALAQHVERVFGPLRAAAPGAVEELRYGRAEPELRAAAAATSAEVVVVARRGRSGLDVDALFSVASRLAVRGPFATLVL